MGLFDEGEGYRGIQERMEEEKDTIEEYCSNLRKQIEKLKEDKSALIAALAAALEFINSVSLFIGKESVTEKQIKEVLAQVKEE